MSYGVNRAKKKRTTRRKKSPPSRGRVRSAAKSKSRAASTKSARRARSTKPKRKSTRKAAPKKKAASAKAKLFTRYDPTTGQKVRVTADTFEYQSWPSRKPSKKAIGRAALVANPVGTLGILGAAAGTKAAEKAGERLARDVLTKGRTAAAQTVLRIAPAAAGLGVAAAAIGAVGAAIYAMGKIAERHDVALGERANAISRAFVTTQQSVIKQLNVASWAEVPADVQKKLVDGYKASIAKVYSGVHTGVFAPSQQIPYGR